MAPAVVITEYGRPASQALADAISRAKSAGPLTPVTVIVPSNFTGLAVRRLLGGGGLGLPGVANVNFVTPFRLAELLAAGAMTGTKPLTNPVLGAAVRQVLATDPKHFASVRSHPSTERALSAAFAELSNVGVAGRRQVREHSASAAAIVDLFDAIAERVQGFHGEADVARAAAQRADLAAALGPFGHLIWYLPGELTAPLASFLRAILHAAPATIVAATTGQVHADREVVRSLRSAGMHLDGDLCDHHNGGTAELEPPRADHIVSVTDADEEVRAVIREIMQLATQGVPLDRIGVFHPVPDPYVRILEQQLAAAELPANGPSRRRLSESIAGRVLLNALALPDQRWRRDRVVALVSSGPVRNGDTPARPAVWDTITRQAGVVADRSDWHAKLEGRRHRLERQLQDRLSAGDDSGAEQRRHALAELDDLRTFVDRLIGLVAAVEHGQGWKDRSTAALDLLRQLLGGTNVRLGWPEAELESYERVEAALERLAMLEQIEPDPSLAVFTAALAAELDVARSRSGRFGQGVVYGPLAAAAGQDLDAVFLLGCAEGLCPAPRRQDVLLSDAARAAAGGDLPLRLDQIHEQHRVFLAAIASAPVGRRWLLFPRGDLRSSRRTRPSRWMLPTASALAGHRLFATDFEHESPRGVHEVASHARALLDATHFASLQERDVAQLFEHVAAGGEPTEHPVSSVIASGLRMQQARRSDAFTVFDGNVGAGMSRPPALTSASRLESWAECGFRYFLSYELGLADRDDPERVIELSALDRGSAVHEILDRFFTEQVERGAPDPNVSWSPQQRRRAQEIALQVFDDYEKRGRTGRSVAWDVQRRVDLALVDEFLSADDEFRSLHGATPAHFELAFGMDGAPPLVVTLPNGTELSFRGVIDRVDTTADGRLIVTDYKTGKGTNYKELVDHADPTLGGTVLQLGLYARAAARRLGEDRVASAYWMVNADVDFARHGYRWDRQRDQQLDHVLTTISDGIAVGAFPVDPGEPDSFFGTYTNCRYCDFNSLCVRDRGDHADAMQDAPELQVRVELRSGPRQETSS